jgi:hypothetical protein
VHPVTGPVPDPETNEITQDGDTQPLLSPGVQETIKLVVLGLPAVVTTFRGTVDLIAVNTGV